MVFKKKPRRKPTMARRRGGFRFRRRRSGRSSGSRGGIGLATVAGVGITLYNIYARYKYYKANPAYQGFEAIVPAATGMGKVWQATPGGWRWNTPQEWMSNITAPAPSSSIPSTTQTYVPALAGFAVSKFIGGNGYMGIPGLQANKFLPGRLKL